MKNNIKFFFSKFNDLSNTDIINFINSNDKEEILSYLTNEIKKLDKLSKDINNDNFFNQSKFLYLFAKNLNDQSLLKKILVIFKQRVHLIKNKLTQWEYEYYGLQKPTVTDTKYDLVLRELYNFEEFLPELKTKNSPTNRVGGTIDNKFKKVEHILPMLSLSNIFSKGEFFKFDETVKKLINKNINIEYNIEPKFDGLSISLIYSKGKLIRGITRGNGKIGEDVTNNIKMISSIPQTINNNFDRFEVRGEVYLDYEQFIKINDSIKDELKKFANPRNAAAGTLRRLDPKLVKQRNIKMVAYYIPNEIDLTKLGIKQQSDVIQVLKQLKFPVASDTWRCNGVNEAYDRINYLEQHQDNLPYPIDGAVIKVNDINLYDLLGSTSKFPHWATAYKFIPKEATTKITNIIANVGRTGKITYVAKLIPVHLSGSVISSATLNNAEYIINKDIRINDTVTIYKAAEIIPYVKSAKIEKRDSSSKPFKPIIKCPVCNSDLEKRKGEIDQYCVNTSCPARILASIIHFCSKTAMDIEGLSEKTLQKFFNEGYIKTIPDIYLLNKYRTEIVEKIYNKKFKVFNKLQEAIEKSKSNSLEKLIAGLGIRDVGSISALILAKKYINIDNLMNTKIEQLQQIKDIGEVVSKSIYDWTHNQSNIELVQKLKTLNINTKYIGSTVSNTDLNSEYYQKNFCITGSFDIPREKIKQLLINKYDANITNSVNKTTNYLIVGENGGSKLEKANKLGIKIISDKIWE